MGTKVSEKKYSFPDFGNLYDDIIGSTLDKLLGLGESMKNDTSAQKKEERYLLAENILDDIISKSTKYSYDLKADPLYGYYKDMYSSKGQLLAKDVFGLASAMTGGYGNSYAATAAGKAAAQQQEKLSEKAGELEEKAYERNKESISLLGDVLDRINENSDREKEEALDEREKAKFLAQYGDYSGLERLGVDVSSLKERELADIAEIFAKYGDYSLLELLGVDTKNREKEDYYNRLLLQAKYNKY